MFFSKIALKYFYYNFTKTVQKRALITNDINFSLTLTTKLAINKTYKLFIVIIYIKGIRYVRQLRTDRQKPCSTSKSV